MEEQVVLLMQVILLGAQQAIQVLDLVVVMVHEDRVQVVVEHKFPEVTLHRAVLEELAKLNTDFYELTKKGK
jgi:hypothetical protein